MESWSLGPPLLVGERIIFRSNSGYLPGTVKWLGRLRECYGNQMVTGLSLDEPLLHGGGDGTFGRRKIYQCPKDHGIFTPLQNVVKFDDFMFVNPGFNFARQYSQEEERRRSSQHHLNLTSPRNQVIHPSAPSPEEIHYQNHFFATIRDSSPERGNNVQGYDPFSSFRTDTDTEERMENYFEDDDGQTWSAPPRRKNSREGPSQPIGAVAEAELIMKRLEEAIAIGNHREAARLAKEVSKMHITAKLTNQEMSQNQKKIQTQKKAETLSLKMYVEDQASYNGPFYVSVLPSMTLNELKKQVECQYEIPVKVQKWILDKTLANDDDSTLASYGINNKHQNIFLYLVSSDRKTSESGNSPKKVEVSEADHSQVQKPDQVERQQEQTVNKRPDPPDNRRGRYWNYEHNRWSICSDEESDDEEAPKPVATGNPAPGHPATGNPVTDIEKPVKDEQQQDEEEIYEWEYYYEDAELAKDNKKNANAAEVGKDVQHKGWECPNCTLVNEDTRPGCAACAAERPPEGATAAVEPKPEGDKAKDQQLLAQGKALDNYKKLDDLDVIPNVDRFECVICFLEIEPGDGVVLRECLHTFCRECLSGAIEHSDSPQVGCPYKDENYSCDMVILEREIKALVSPTVYEKLQQKSLKEAQANSKNTFQCKTPDCNGWCFVNDNINNFKCPLCQRLNCITCQAIHEGQDCKQYQQSMLNEAQDENSVKTKKWIEGLITTGEALQCPSCQVILLKKWGCDWVRCTYCRTEICWITRQLRWGPNGKGDTSGGCRCMADGRTKCHPMCNYCH